jgi:phospholipid/cholesterol/gamma-HCH transport system permease protein
VLEGSDLEAIDTAGAWVLQRWLRRHGASAEFRHWPPRLERLMTLVVTHPQAPPPRLPRRSLPNRTGRSAAAAWQQAIWFLQATASRPPSPVILLVRPTSRQQRVF